MKTFLLVIKRYIQTVSQAVVSLVKPEFHLPVLTRAVLRKGLPRYKLSHNSLPSVTLWDRKEVNPGVMHVYPLITHMRAFKAVNPRWSPDGHPSFTPVTEHRTQTLRNTMPKERHLHTLTELGPVVLNLPNAMSS